MHEEKVLSTLAQKLSSILTTYSVGAFINKGRTFLLTFAWADNDNIAEDCHMSANKLEITQAAPLLLRVVR